MIYKLEPIWKKSVVDVEHWYKEIDGKKIWIERELGWRWGSCTFESEEFPEIDLKNEYNFNISDELEVIDYEADDGCWESFNFPADMLAEETERIEEMDFEGLEEDGWQLYDTETIFTGPLKLTDENGNTWRGEGE